MSNPDYSEEFEDKPLPLNLYEENDDERDLWIKPRLESLVNGTLTPQQLASDVDTRITEDTNRKHDELMKRPDPCHLTEEEEEDEMHIVPRLRYHISPLFSAIVCLCTAFPAYHPGQTQLVEFLLALQSLPHHEIYAGLPPEDPSEPYLTVPLWRFEEEEGYWQMFPTYFREETKGAHPPLFLASCIHNHSSDTDFLVWLAPYRLRNVNVAMARLTALRLCNCARLSALLHILPSDNEYPDLEKRPIDGPNKLGNNLIAAAQWILPHREGQYVYQECKQFESDPEWRKIWCMAHWREWKRQFAFVAGDERFAARYREMAERAYRQMLVYEKEDTNGQ